jgi:hypothetical protein
MKIKSIKNKILYIFCISFGFIFIIFAIIALTIGNSFQVSFSQGYIPPPPISPSQNSIQSQFTQQSPSSSFSENQQPQQPQQPQNSMVNPQSQIVGGIDMSKIPGLNNTMNVGNPPALNDAPNSTNSKDVKIAFTGTVTQVDDRSNNLNGNVRVGDKITGEYTYKLSTKDSNTDQTVGDYRHDKKAFGITVNARGLVFKTDPKNVNFLVELVNRGTDHYLLRSYNNLPLSDAAKVEHISWQLDDETGNALSNDSLKTAPTPPVLQNWKDLYGLTITGGGGDRVGDPSQSFLIRAHIDSVALIS